MINKAVEDYFLQYLNDEVSFHAGIRNTPVFLHLVGIGKFLERSHAKAQNSVLPD